ncbi:hypothetical protein E8E11_011984 [Didymella keratinophila]|nr:hypothetical protein E8E11_011984 [Didymella keratinophila]
MSYLRFLTLCGFSPTATSAVTQHVAHLTLQSFEPDPSHAALELGPHAYRQRTQRFVPQTYAHYLDSLPALRDVGLTFALLYLVAAALPILLLQVSNDEDIDRFYNRMGDFSPAYNSAMEHIPSYLNFIELHNLVVETAIALLFIE